MNTLWKISDYETEFNRDITDEDKLTLKITKKVGALEAFDQFCSVFNGRFFRGTEKNIIWNKWIIIWEDNRFLLNKIKKEKEIIEILLNLDNYKNVETIKGDSQNLSLGKTDNENKTDYEGKDKNDSTNKISSQNRFGETTQNSWDDKKDYLDLSEKITAAHLTETKTKDNNETINLTEATNTTTNKGNSINKTLAMNIMGQTRENSNSSVDAMELANKNISEFRKNFFRKFRYLFLP